MIRFLLFTLLIFSFATFADHNKSKQYLEKIESLQDMQLMVLELNKYLENTDLTEKLRLRGQFSLVGAYINSTQFEYAILEIVKIEELAKLNDLKSDLAKAYKMYGVVFYYQAKYNESLSYYQKSLDYYKNIEQTPENLIRQANLLNNIALVHTKLNNFVEALQSYLAAQPIYEQYGDEVDIVDVKGNIATLYIKLKRYDIAVKQLKEVAAQRILLSDEYGLAMATGDLGVAYKYMGKYKLAQQEALKSLKYFQLNNRLYDEASQLNNLSEAYIFLGDNEKAEFYAKQSIELCKKIGSMQTLANSYQSLAQAQFSLGHVEEALISLNLSTQTALALPDERIVNNNVAIKSLLKSSIGENKIALLSLLSYMQKNLDFNNEKLNKQLSIFESAQLQQEIDKLQQNEQLQKIAQEKENQQENFILIAVSFILLVLLLLYRRHLESQLTQRLEVRVNERTIELELLAADLVRANKIKNQFVANMSHEIRTPLTAVIGHTESILRGDTKEDELTDEVKIIHENSLHLLNIVNDVLDMSKIEENKLALSFTEVNIHTLLHSVSDMFRKQAKRKGLSFNVDNELPDPFVITVDSGRLKQILLNLCSNALKFTDKGKVRLSVKLSTSYLVFSVEDTGIGMSEKQIKHVFGSFNQADDSISRRFGGTGLGLYISKQLATILDGNITVTSELGKGSVFVFNLPINEAVEYQKSKFLEDTQSQVEALEDIYFEGKIILAEDHPENRRLISRLLTNLGLEVIEAKNGLEVIELCQHHKVSAIFMDIQMPEMDGIEALEKLKQLKYPADVYALTANAMTHEVEKYLLMGFAGHLSKPIERDKFVAVIANHYQKSEKSKLGQSGNNVTEEIDLSDLSQTFKSSLPKQKSTIIALYKENKLDDLAKAVHHLAGAAYLFNAVALAQCASDIETSLKKGNKVDQDFMDCLLDEIDAAQII